MASVATGWRVAAALVLALFAAAAIAFARHQAIWIDETTQLFGLTLPFGQQLDWLSGAVQIASGVPPDRAAPMSYWLGGIWAALYGLGEMQMRLVGILCMLAGAPASLYHARACQVPFPPAAAASDPSATATAPPTPIAVAVDLRVWMVVSERGTRPLAGTPRAM